MAKLNINTKLKKLAAFTLAEIMLTMTIVGVVAALTIPSLHYQRTKKEYTAKLKNFFSKVNNAVLDMQIDKGSFRDIKVPPAGNTAKGFQWWLDNIDPYLGHSLVNKDKKTIYFKDGSSVGIAYVGLFLEFWYDVNGDKAPNKLGYDRYMFLFGFDDTSRLNCFGNVNTFFGPYCPAGVSIAGMDRSELVNRCKNGNPDGSYNNATWCVKLLQNDQWEFKSDYPFKF